MRMHRAELTIGIGEDSKEYAAIAGGSSGINDAKVKVTADKKNIKAVVEADDSKKLLEAMNSFIKEIRVIDSVWKVIK